MKTIVWDVDDVLNDLMRCWFENAWLPTHPNCILKYEDLTENPPHMILKITKKDYLTSVDVFRLSKAAQKMRPVPEVIEWFTKYGDRFRHVALTGRPLKTIPAVSSWLFQYFGAWIRTFHFIPASREGQSIPEYDCSKGEYLRWLGKVDILVDDCLDNIDTARNLGITGILMPHPWNKGRITIAETMNLLTQLI